MPTSRLEHVARLFQAEAQRRVSFADAAQLVLADDLGGADIVTFDAGLAALARRPGP